MADSFHPHPPNSDLAEVFALAQGLAWQKRYQEAQSLYLEVLKRQPQNYEALVNLGILAYESGHTAAAKTAYAQAARVAPQRGLAHLHWGHLLLHAGDLTAAKFQYESALQVEPDLAAAHQGLSVVLLEQGEAPDSEAGSVLMHNIIPRLSETPGQFRHPAPLLGEHSRSVLKSIGFGTDKIDALAAAGTIKEA